MTFSTNTNVNIIKKKKKPVIPVYYDNMIKRIIEHVVYLLEYLMLPLFLHND